MKPFSYEHSFTFDEELYVNLNSIFLKKTKHIRLGLSLLLGAVCLFWTVTFLVGILIICLGALTVFSIKKLPATSANSFNSNKYLHGELIYGINEKELWIKGKDISVVVGWVNVVVWDERDEWFKLSASGTPTFWFQIEELKKHNIYEQVVELCEEHAVRFNK
ncbi:MAG: hypothetical protein ACRBEE_00845 [Arenicella sp.]